MIVLSVSLLRRFGFHFMKLYGTLALPVFPPARWGLTHLALTLLDLNLSPREDPIIRP